jgi:hypothetical protein
MSETNLFSSVHCSNYVTLVQTNSRTRFPSVRELAELHIIKSVMAYVVIYFVIAIRNFDN